MNVCAQISTVLVAGSFVISPAAAQPKYSDWSTPVNLGCTINSAAADQGPALSKDGLSLYFASARVAPGAQGAANRNFSSPRQSLCTSSMPRNISSRLFA